MKWEKKFILSRDGDVVVAEYDRLRTYRLRFAVAAEAERFVKAFESVQEEIEKNGKLKTVIKITITAHDSEPIVKFSFIGKEKTIRFSCELETVAEMLSFYRTMRSQIAKYSK